MKSFLYFFILFLGVVIAPLAYGADTGITYKSLANVPGLDGTHLSTEGYVNTLYYLSITFGGLLAVIQIIYGGVEWTFSDAFTEKSSAKARITGALFGLLIILTAVLLLETINKNLTTLNIFSNAPEVTVTNNNPIVDTRTECQKNANSKGCCDERGGNFIKSGKFSPLTCSLGAVGVTPPNTGETEEEKRLGCLSVPKQEWKAGVCRSTTGKQVPFPPGYTDDDGADDFKRADYCTSAWRGDYNPDNDTCTVNQ